MDKAKAVNLLSLDTMDLEAALKQQDKVVVNDHAILIFNGNIQRSPIFHKKEIYQIADSRIVLAMEGCGDVCINLQDYHVEKGFVMLIPPDTIFEVNEVSPDARLTAIVIRDSIDIPEEVIRKTTPAEYDRLLRMFYLLWDVIQLTPYCRKTVQHLLRAIVSDIQELKEAEEKTIRNEGSIRTQELFLQFKRLVHQYCMQERSIPFYADLLHVTPHHLSAIIKKASGQSVMYWINRATVQEAKLLLKTNKLMAYEIANRMNFTSASAFSKFFKRETGMTPRAYQEKTSR